MKTITLTTKELFFNFYNSTGDMLWSDRSDAFINIHQEMFVTQIKALAFENMEEIRTMFKEGYTCMLVNDMIAIDPHFTSVTDGVDKDEVEIRVINRDGELIGVVIESEINY